jgi:probable HAF family extracellular repeat protein
MVDLGSFGGGNSYALDINDHGQIAGTSEDASGGQWAAVWRLSGSTWPIENLGTARRLPGLGGGTTYALAVNNSGDVAGFSTDPSGTRHAVRWRASDGWTVEDLGTLGGCCSEGYGINSFGDVVGVSNLGKRSGTQHGFLARPDALMADLAAQGQSAARDLNDFGAVVGGGGGRGVHAVLWRGP